jgi:hypothetical protein
MAVISITEPGQGSGIENKKMVSSRVNQIAISHPCKKKKKNPFSSLDR